MWIEILRAAFSFAAISWVGGLFASTIITSNAYAQTSLSSNCSTEMPCCSLGWSHHLNSTANHNGSMPTLPCGVNNDANSSSNAIILLPCCNEVNMRDNSSVVPCCGDVGEGYGERSTAENETLVRVSGGYVRGVVSYLGGKSRPAHVFRVGFDLAKTLAFRHTSHERRFYPKNL